MASFETDLLAELIERRHRCVVELHRLGIEQEQLIQAGDMGRLLQSLSVKQKQLAQLQQIQHELRPFHNQDPDARRWRSQQIRRRCAALLAESESLLAEIVEREKQNEQQLCRRRDQAAARLEGFHTASQARGAYAAHAGRTTVRRPLGGDAPSPRLDLSAED